MNQKDILVPLDGSRVSRGALPYAEAVAKAINVPVRLLAVVEKEPDELLSKINGSEYLKLVRQEATDFLARTAAEVREAGLDVSTKIVAGRPVEAILAEAEACDASMIVMATHGKGGFERWLVGSVTDEVMRTNSRPTLLVTPSEIPAPKRTVYLNTLMVPLDGSTLAEAALPIATELAAGSGAKLQLVQALPPLEDSLPFGYTPESADDWEARTSIAQDYLKTVKRRLPATLPVETIVLRHAGTDLLVDYAQNAGIDLVVMATHGRGGLRRLVLGSVADRFVRCGVPTLLVRPQNTDRGLVSANATDGAGWQK